MPLHDRRYRRREPRGPLARFRALPIARETLRGLLRRRALLLFGAAALVPFVIGAGALLLTSRLPELAEALPPLPELFARYLGLMTLLAVLLTVWAGAGLLADDLRTGALLVYLSRPLTRADYVMGKLGVLAALNLALLAAPALVLWALAVALNPHDLAARGLVLLPLAVLAQSLLAALVLAVLGLGASALTRSAPVAGAALVALLVLPDAAALVAPPAARTPLQLISVRGDLSTVAGALFAMPPDPSGVHWAVALLCLLAMAAVAGALLWRRVRAVEVVA